MSRSLKVRSDCIRQAKLALQHNGFPSQRAFAEELGLALSTLSRFLTGKTVDYGTFVEICGKLDLDWRSISDLGDRVLSQCVCVESSLFTANRHQDWGEAPDVSVFYGRSDELTTLEQWIVRDNCRLVVLLGMGGIGKTALAAKLAQQLELRFEFVIWRSLGNAPPVEEILAELIQFLSNQQEINLPTNKDGRILRLINYLRSSRCLLVLDNAESVLQAGDEVPHGFASRTGHFREGYEGYGELLKCVGETNHHSSLILTSREKPQGLAALEGETLPVRCLQLTGLPEAQGREIFSAKGSFTGSEDEWTSVISRYGGNPLALKIVASGVTDFFDSSISRFLEFLKQGSFIFDDIRDLLERQFQRLSDIEQEIMYWLAINREPVLLEELQEDFVSPVSASQLLEALGSLQRRSLIEKIAEGFTQQPVVMEYIITILIERIGKEIASQEIFLFSRHALVKAQAKDYVRETQIRLILTPAINKARSLLGFHENLEKCLAQILEMLRGKSLQQTGYAGGNIINLLCQLQVDLSGYDFSNLTVWQANLQRVNLHNVNFTKSDLRQSVFSEAMGNILTVAFSPDGELLATGDTDCNIRLWQMRTGQQLLTLRGHTNWVRSIAFSPQGKTLISGSADQTVRLWDFSTGQCCLVCTGHNSGVYSVTFSPDGQTLVSGSADQTVKFWDVRDGKCLKTCTGHTDWVRSVAFSPDGQTLVSGSADKTVKFWDVRDGKCYQTWKGHSNWVYSVAFSYDGKILASGSADRTVRLWDVRTGKCLRTCTGHSNGVYSVAFSPDGETLASASLDHTVRLWDVRTGKCLRTCTGHTNQVCSVAIGPQGKTLASVSLDSSVKFWDVSTGSCLKTCTGYTSWVYSVNLSSDGQTLASGSADQTVRLWDVSTGICLRTLHGHTNQVYSVALSSDGKTVASGSADQTVRLWDVSTGICLRTLYGHSDWVYSVAFSPDSQTLVSASADRTVRLWDVSTAQCIRNYSGHRNAVYSVTFSPDGKTLASGSLDKTIRLWNVSTGQCIRNYSGHSNAVYSVAFSPDGQTLVSGSTDETVKLWNVDDGKCLRTCTGHTNWVYSVAFSCCGKTVASASFDSSVRIWNVRDGKCCQILTGHTHQICSVAYALHAGYANSPDAQTVITGATDETVRLWNVDTGECLKILRTPKLYEGMSIAGVTGVTQAQKATLKALGAIDRGE